METTIMNILAVISILGLVLTFWVMNYAAYAVYIHEYGPGKTERIVMLITIPFPLVTATYAIVSSFFRILLREIGGKR